MDTVGLINAIDRFEEQTGTLDDIVDEMKNIINTYFIDDALKGVFISYYNHLSGKLGVLLRKHIPIDSLTDIVRDYNLNIDDSSIRILIGNLRSLDARFQMIRSILTLQFPNEDVVQLFRLGELLERFDQYYSVFSSKLQEIEQVYNRIEEMENQ